MRGKVRAAQDHLRAAAKPGARDFQIDFAEADVLRPDRDDRQRLRTAMSATAYILRMRQGRSAGHQSQREHNAPPSPRPRSRTGCPQLTMRSQISSYRYRSAPPDSPPM